MAKRSVFILALLVSIWVGGCQTQEKKIPKLIQDLGHDTPSFRWMRTTPREIAKKKLGKMGKDAVPALTQALSQENSNIQNGVIDTLASIGKDAVPAMIQLLQDPSVQSYATAVLLKMAAKESVPGIAQILKNGRSEFRSSAAEILGRIGSEDIPKKLIPKVESDSGKYFEFYFLLSDIVSILKEALQDDVPNVRSQATNSLIQIAIVKKIPEAINAVLPVLKQALQNDDAVVRSQAANTLMEIGTPNAFQAMLPILIQALQNEDSTIRAKAALALEEIGTPDALKAVKEYESRQ
ncbi:TPA: HEAT repeat domain-containing protein [Candidatus Poribacteria bacterium]|nr:HEAT repeat domain-containing protein [Candidatus Poribacteria bacterium]